MKMPIWTDNTTFDAQAAHFAVAYGFLLTVHRFHGPELITTVIGIALAAAKEFWYDATYELPKQTFDDNFTDFAWYILGLLAANLILL